MAFKDWVRLPTAWIEERGLRKLRWAVSGGGADNAAALMTLAAIAHNADDQIGLARLTYDSLCVATGLSRSKLSNGLDVLEKLKVLERTPDGRSTYKLAHYNPTSGWAKFPAKSMYKAAEILSFRDLSLRRVVELDALKLFFLLVARRDRNTNLAKIGYGKISDYTGIERSRIKSALSLLASLSLMHVERVPSKLSVHGVASAYRIVGLDSYVHMGTRGRALDALVFDSPTGSE